MRGMIIYPVKLSESVNMVYILSMICSLVLAFKKKKKHFMKSKFLTSQKVELIFILADEPNPISQNPINLNQEKKKH